MLKLCSYEEGCENVALKTVQKLGSGSMDASYTRHMVTFKCDRTFIVLTLCLLFTIIKVGEEEVAGLNVTSAK